MDVSMESLEEKQEENALGDTEKIPSSHKTKSYGISIDSGLIRSVPVEEQVSVLRNLGVNVFNQDDFEEGVLKQVDEAIAVKETEEIVKGWEKNLKAVDEDIKTVENELQEIDQILKRLEVKSATGYESWRRTQAVQKQKDNKLRQLKKLQATQKTLHHKLGVGKEDEGKQKLDECETSDGNDQVESENRKLLLDTGNKSEQDVLIKTGEMTPFGGLLIMSQGKRTAWPIAENHQNDNNDDEYVPDEGELKYSWYEDESDEGTGREPAKSEKQTAKKRSLNVAYREEDSLKSKKKKRTRKMGRRLDTGPVDDGSEKIYRNRIRELRIKELLKKRSNSQADDNDEEEFPDMEFDKGLKIPGKIWHKLYKYQQTGVQWLWELHCQQAGGIVGDEMGLGKTIQMIVFLAGLKYSKISAKKSKRGGLGPVLIVCPVTVLHQWVQEFHKWWPEFRVAVLHDTGTYNGFKQELIKKICNENGVLVTSYSGMRQHQERLLAERFDYVILDEGHKIRNPDAEITLACKQFRTCHRIILSGSPMQNNLRELWSLFDFVFPGKLGTLPVFMTEFSVPITMGGYCNATKVQVETAYRCASVLRDTINPYLLRRLKKDVNMSLDLPTKNEQVLFCRLTQEQRELYQQYLDSKEVQSILAGNYKVFPGLIMLRKICNHPDLTSQAGSLWKAKQDLLKVELGERGEEDEPDPDEGYGDATRSGKMIVVKALLKMWHEQGHRVLLFSQTRQMLNILEQFVLSRGYTYFRMDGSTSVASRQPLVNNFNEDRSVFLFLLTTRVGGVGVNLVGADRVLIYDPDWNPSTDTQARERAWRIGQKRHVTIYRLITTGTIEEKIYHRQIFKQFLTNRVLKDPKQRRFFKSNDLYELFTLDSCDKQYGTETSAIFAGSNCEVKVPGSRKRKKKEAKREEQEKPKASAKMSAKRTVKESSKTEERDEQEAAGGAFSIDWRDIAETRSLTKNEEGEKDMEKCESKEVDAKSNEEESAAQVVVIDEEKGDNSAKLNEATIEDLAEDVAPTLHPDLNIAEKGESTSSTCEVPQLLNNISAYSESNPQKATGVKSRKGKGKISSLSDEELKKRIRLKQKKKKRRRAKLDGKHIENLDYHEIYNPQITSQSSAEEMEEQKQHSARQDEFILKHLFKKTGVHSALKHDVIMESSNPDVALVENEANRVAQSAVKALKRSRQRCLRAVSGVPTWTGVSGSSGLSDPPPPKASSSSQETKPHFSGDLMGMNSATVEGSEAVHSSQLLAKMRSRNNMLPCNDTGSEAPGSENDDLLVQIRNFIASKCTTIGRATTQEILDEFGSKLPQSDSVVFRSMLRQICTFTRDSLSGKGIWLLNEEFN
ncbi:DNA excision repair protein ERCC-6 [Desmophyllum pertusum]|uniref:DNA excision repair protein ERCC-6 n=1 Tax=Desmophyllum pertusum TaxID=174260 RepID=A0A9W9YPW4_9CNID|nr:DNA excision repair protein ERCC-6 [Desmophyllum pertusum]